jgi:hypothetical protein
MPRAFTQERVASKRETGVGEIKQRYHEGDHPRTMLTQENNPLHPLRVVKKQTRSPNMFATPFKIPLLMNTN